MPDDDQAALTPERELAAVREQMATLQAERDAAVQRAEQETNRADGLHGQVLDGSRRLAETGVQSLALQEQSAESTIASLNSAIVGWRAQAASLTAEGKFDEAEEVREKISAAAAERNEAQRAKAYYGQQKTQAAAQPVDPIERFFAANPQFTPAEREWIARNPRYATDSAFQQRANAAHALATESGIQRGSPEYYQALERAAYQRPAPQPQAARQQAPARQATAEIPEDVDPGDPYSDGAAEIVEEEPVPQPAPRPAPRQTAAPPSRRSPTTPPRQPNRAYQELTPEQSDTALKNADLAPPEIQAQGDAAILAWWAEMNQSPTAKRLRQEWAGI